MANKTKRSDKVKVKDVEEIKEVYVKEAPKRKVKRGDIETIFDGQGGWKQQIKK